MTTWVPRIAWRRALLGGLLGLCVGCGVADSQPDEAGGLRGAGEAPEEVSEQDLRGGERVKLDEQLGAAPNRMCDHYTLMTVTRSRRVRNQFNVTLQRKTDGTCAPRTPNRMQFAVLQHPAEPSACGSVASSGDGVPVGPIELGADQPPILGKIPIKIWDHRKRLCEDFRAPFEVTVGQPGAERRLYARIAP